MGFGDDLTFSERDSPTLVVGMHVYIDGIHCCQSDYVATKFRSIRRCAMPEIGNHRKDVLDQIPFFRLLNVLYRSCIFSHILCLLKPLLACPCNLKMYLCSIIHTAWNLELLIPKILMVIYTKPSRLCIQS